MPFIIDDTTPDFIHSPGNFAKGHIPRNYEKYKVGFYAAAPPLQIPLIPRGEYVDRIKDMNANKSRVSDIRRRSGPNGGPIPSLDQNGQGYCWGYSCAIVIMLVRAIMNQPYVRLSGHMIGCLVKSYRDEGGWCGLSLEFVERYGVASVETWKEKSMSRSNDTPEMRADALRHKVSHSWADMQASVYDRNLNEDQAMTLLLTSTPIQGDFNHWGHSVGLMDPTIASEYPQLFQGVQVYSHLNLDTLLSTDFDSLDLHNNAKDREIYTAAFGKRGINSWTDSWGDLGEFILTGSKALLDGGVCPLVTNAS